MRVVYVDDEKAALTNFYYDNRNRTDISEQEYFQNPMEALEYVTNHEVDAAFLDITMPDMDGIELGWRMKHVRPDVELVYVTGYDDYALDVFKLGGRAYLSKPYSDQELEDVYTLLKRLIPDEEARKRKELEKDKRVYMKTFGNFDMVVDGTIMTFRNSKAKELLAVLVDSRGGSVTNTQIFYKLWEGKEYNNMTSTYVRRTIRALKQELEAWNLGDMLVSNRKTQNIDVTMFECDYYKSFDGDKEAMRAYRGYYMTQYSWAEETNAMIEQLLEN